MEVVLGCQVDEVEQASRRPSDVVRVVQPGRQPVDQAFEHARLPTLVHGEIGPVEDESLVQELQHGNLVPGRAIEADVARAVRGVAVHLDRRLQVVDPFGREARERAVGGEGPVERHGEQALDDLVVHARNRRVERVSIGDPRIAVGEAPPEQLERVAGHPRLCRERGRVEGTQIRDLTAPGVELAGDRGLIEEPRAIEVVEIVK